MTANTIRSFAVGLLFSALVCGAVYFFGSGNESKASSKETDKKSEEAATLAEMKATLEEEGYVVLTTDEYAANTQKENKPAQSTQKEPAKDAAKDTATQPATGTPAAAETPPAAETVTKTVITVRMGMTGIDIRDSLVAAKIITDGQAFTDALERSGRASDLQPGSYEVNSGMNVNELINAIFGSE